MQDILSTQTFVTENMDDSESEHNSEQTSVGGIKMSHSDSHKVQGTLQHWKSLSSEYETACQLFQSDDTSIICPIMHEPPCSAQLEEIPGIWPVNNNVGANTVRLECAHSFFVQALVLHFLGTDMRCPVCRAGSSEKMDIACVSSCERDSYIQGGARS